MTDNLQISGIAPLLVNEGLFDRQEAANYQKLAQKAHIPILTYLLDNKLANADKLALTISENSGSPFMDLDALDLDLSPLNLVNEKLIKRHFVLPLYTRGNALFIGMDDPSKTQALKEIQFHTGLHTSCIIVKTEQLQSSIESLLDGNKNNINDLEDGDGDLGDLDFDNDENEPDNELQRESIDDAPVVKFINKIIIDAIKKGASDIHFEPYEREYRIRYRQDGILISVASPPISLSSRITARLKIMSNLDISERRLPQDGRFKMKLSKTSSIDFRVNTCPTVGGEKIVLRILDPSATKLGIESLGFLPHQKDAFLHAIQKPQGMILVTGPTGSGKTVTLYTALNILNLPENNISTAEDPVEIKVPGINQVNINPKTGLTFSSTLRAFLRQDPDVIMVGEIRDLETAEISVKAAQTGHLVLSTLHTNSAAETLTRMMSMGIPAFNIASSLNLIIAQRLARKLCNKCKTPHDELTEQNLVELGFNSNDVSTITVYKAGNCSECANGYRGRLGVFEVLPVTKNVSQAILNEKNTFEILEIAENEGMLTLYQSGLELVKQGITSLEEINRITVE